MDQSIQQNAAMLEETSAASQTLASESVSLSELLAQFRDHDQRRATPVPASPSRREPIARHPLPATTLGNTALKPSDWEEF